MSRVPQPGGGGPLEYQAQASGATSQKGQHRPVPSILVTALRAPVSVWPPSGRIQASSQHAGPPGAKYFFLC